MPEIIIGVLAAAAFAAVVGAAWADCIIGTSWEEIEEAKKDNETE